MLDALQTKLPCLTELLMLRLPPWVFLCSAPRSGGGWPTDCITRAPLPSGLSLSLASGRHLPKIWRQEERRFGGIFLHFLPPSSFRCRLWLFPSTATAPACRGLPAQPASQCQGNSSPALQPPAIARLWEPQRSYGCPHPCPPSPFIEMSLLDHPRGFVIPAGIPNDRIFKRA